jgi:hypothetical protein
MYPMVASPLVFFAQLNPQPPGVVVMRGRITIEEEEL